MSNYLITYLNYGYVPFFTGKICTTSLLGACLCLPPLFISHAPLLLKIAPWLFLSIYLVLSLRLISYINMPRYCCYFHFALSSSTMSFILMSDAAALWSIYYSNAMILFCGLIATDGLLMFSLCRFFYVRLKKGKMAVTGKMQGVGFFAIFPVIGLALGRVLINPSSKNEEGVAMIAIILCLLAYLVGMVSVNFNKAYIIKKIPDAERILKDAESKMSN